MDRDTLHRAIAHADYLVLGEIHDNPWHHREQARLLALFADLHGGDLAAGFEQLTVDQRAALDAFLRSPDAGAEALGRAVSWSESGWPEYRIYRPLFEAALARELPIVPLMFSASSTRAIMTNGIQAVLPEAALERLRPDSLLGRKERALVEQDMQDAHCGELPTDMLPAMVDVQIARDAFMAHTIVEAAARAVIITGNGHARRDRGMPRFLQRLRPDARIVVVTLLEASGAEAIPEQARRAAQSEITDYALFTPEHPRRDPCLAFQ